MEQSLYIHISLRILRYPSEVEVFAAFYRVICMNIDYITRYVLAVYMIALCWNALCNTYANCEHMQCRCYICNRKCNISFKFKTEGAPMVQHHRW